MDKLVVFTVNKLCEQFEFLADLNSFVFCFNLQWCLSWKHLEERGYFLRDSRFCEGGHNSMFGKRVGLISS